MAVTTETTRTPRIDRLAPPEHEKTGKYALISVWDKTDIEVLADALSGAGYQIISTGGTARYLIDHGIGVVPIDDVTGRPEILDGRVKTISREIEGGLLYDRDNQSHVAEAREEGIPDIDIVVVNFYPFEETVARPDVTDEEAIESIDVGGPTMVRAAAKNHKHVTVVIDPADYARVADAIRQGSVTPELRRELAAKVFHWTAYYDAQIGMHMSDYAMPPENTALPLSRDGQMRYGENPHQNPAFAYFIPGTESPMKHLQHHGGRESSHTNITDIVSGLEAVRIFDEPAAVAIKHNTPCGIALGDTAAQAVLRATASDPKSVFGGAVVLNTPADQAVAEVVQNLFDSGIKLDIVAAPSMDEETIGAIMRTRETTGVYTFGPIPPARRGYDRYHFRAIDGGVLVQPQDDSDEDFEAGFANWDVPTEAKPTEGQLQQARLAWKFLSRIRSNSVIVVDPEIPMATGIGTGQTSRVYAASRALELAGDRASGAIMASDSFFPFDDCVKLAGEAGIGLVVQQGGSVRDKASIAAANSLGIPMIFTHRRAFWH